MTISKKFTGNFTQQEPLPPESIAAATRVMQHGRLHRYNTTDGETAEVALLEREFADYTGAKYCLAVASCGYALGTALRAIGVTAGEPVLTNAFTLAPVPGAIAGAGAKPVFVETTENLTIDLDDLRAKATTTKSRVLLLSHMRGHLADMDAICDIADNANLRVIEDCAHTMGAAWNGTPSGRFGVVGCYSTQTFKHINSGEGGLLITDDAEIMARATMLSGSYMFYGEHIAGAEVAAFDDIALDTPNCSGRMDNLRAAVLRPQLARLDAQVAAWNARYAVVERGLAGLNGVAIPHRPPFESIVGSSFQFRLPHHSAEEIEAIVARCAERGVVLKWFGAARPQGFTSRHDSWRYVAPQKLPQSDKILAGLLDMRLPLTFSLDDCEAVVAIIREEISN